MQSLRVMMYDATCGGRPLRPGLTDAWRTGGKVYAALGRFDAWRGVRSWDEALAWLATVEPTRSLGEVQYWGHGTWGRVWIANEALDVSAFGPHHRYRSALEALRTRLAPGALVWFRTCETFGTARGHRFARAWTDFFQRRAAGHTYVIGALQSGLHSLAPGRTPTWSADEGIERGVVDPQTALASRWTAPHTITALRANVPAGW